MFVNELVRLGADVRIDGHHAVVRGRERLSSAPVLATDIPLSIWKMVQIWFIRVVLTVLITVPVAHLIF